MPSHAYVMQASKKALLLGGASEEAGQQPLRERDRVLATIRVFNKLKPEERRWLLTDKVGRWVGG